MKDQLTINRARVTKQGVETKTTQDGRPMARFTIMWSSSRKDKTGQWENGPTKFVQVIAFDDLARWVASGVKAEALVGVSGTIEHFEWQSQNGPQDSWTMIANFVAPYTPRQQSNQQQGYGQQNQPQQGQGFPSQSTPQQPPAQSNDDPWNGQQASFGAFDDDSEPPF